MVSHLWRRWSSVTRLTRWLPHVPLLHLDAWHTDDTATQLTVRVTSTPALVHGPICRFPTRRVHRRDVRKVMELPWGPWRVVLHLQVRKFFCANGRCTRRLLTERLAPLVAPWARRTQRLAPWTDRGRSRLTPDTPDLLERWNAGCRDALRLFREIH